MPPRPKVETLACCALAVAHRWPAVCHPWAWVNLDGAYGAFVSLHILQGLRPVPVFTEGANYQGTLKSHIAAALGSLTHVHDLSWLMLAASLMLYLIFIAASMALARRIAGRGAALVTGLYLALSPRFLTVFSLNCVGQYVDVLALGGLALAILGRILDEPKPARPFYFAIGLCLGAAFWQQPVALAYLLVAAVALGLHMRATRDAGALLAGVGCLVGALPAVLWNAQHGWSTGAILVRDPAELGAQLDALPLLVRRTFTISFPILSGLSPGHPWATHAVLRAVAAALLPVLFLTSLWLTRKRLFAAGARPLPALLAPLLVVFCLSLFWCTASGRVYWRPRYLLPLLAAGAIQLGVVVSAIARRSRLLAAATIALLLLMNLVGTLPRLRESREMERPFQELIRSLDAKGIRTGYADFAVAAPVTMFTAERIVFSPRLGPTPAYESDQHAERVRQEGPDAYVLQPDDDIARFAAALQGLGVRYLYDPYPQPTFFGFSRRVPIEEVAGFRNEFDGTTKRE